MYFNAVLISMKKKTKNNKITEMAQDKADFVG